MDRRTVRRIAVGVLVTAGAALLWLAPETLPGAIALLAGLALEAIGVRLDQA